MCGLRFARNEIMWYFDHFDYDLTGKRKQMRKNEAKAWADPSISELIWVLQELRKKVCEQSEGMGCYNLDIIKHFANEAGELFETAKQLIRVALENPDIEKDNVGLMLNGIIEYFEAETASKDWHLRQDLCFKDFQFTWARFQNLVNIPNSTPSIPSYAELVDSIAKLLEKCTWIGEFDEKLLKSSSLSNLYFTQHLLVEHIKEAIELNLETQAKYLSAFAQISQDIVESDFVDLHVAVNTTEYCREVYSVLGKLASSIAHDVLLYSVSLEKATHQRESVQFHPAAATESPTKKRSNHARKEVIKNKPGHESSFKDVDTVINS